MKTLFTNSPVRTFVITFVIALSTLNLAGQTRHTVAVTDYEFTPAALTVSVGDTVVWTNTGSMEHNVNGTQATYPTNPESFGNDVGLGWTYEHVFETAGTYDYQCDPHVDFGMVGTVTVNPAVTDSLTLTVNFTSMTPHVGQTFWLAVVDSINDREVKRVKQIATADFSIEVPDIEMGQSYNVDFWADHNGNGVYDAPPADHAWRLPLHELMGDTTLDFVHNTTFTDIEWKTKLSVHFTEMDPHLGQMLTIYVRDLEATLDTMVCMSLDSAELYESSFVIEPTKSYTIDIWADHNSNGTYDAPPVDHAWRLLLNNVVGDTIIEFVHNTNFFDISIPTPNEEELEGQLSSLRLYPNPANQYIDLIIPGSFKNIRSLKVYSVTGILIEEKVVSENIESYRYDLSKLKNGVYFMEINSDKGKNTYKFLKQ